MSKLLSDQELESAILHCLGQESMKSKLSGYSDINLARSHLTRHFGLLYKVNFARAGKVLHKIPLQNFGSIRGGFWNERFSA